MPAKPSTSRVAPTESRPLAPTRNAPADKSEPRVLFQKFFKSISRRHYAAKIKETPDGNQFLVLTDERMDQETGELKKSKVTIHSEDFMHYFRMLHDTAQFIKTHPVSEDLKMKRMRHWAKKEAEQVAAARLAAEAAAAKPARPVKPTKVAPARTTQRRAARGR
jgi:hypothetical protein